MKVSDMHKMRLQEALTRKQLSHKKSKTPLAKEIEIRREEIIRDILGDARNIIRKQLDIASLTVSDESKNNDTVLKATNALLDRAFGKPKESIDFTGNVQFSLKDLAQKRLEVENEDVTPLEDLI